MGRTGIIGLGRMGSAIAQRMAAEGRDVVGWTRSGKTIEGIPSAQDMATLADSCDTLVLSLYDDAAVAEVLDALLEPDLTGKLIIETSTVVPAVLQDRIARITELGGMAVDAPISGGPELVEAGKCGIFIGGDDASAARASTCLAAISDRVFHVGPLGAGLAMKVINNGMLQTYFNGLADYMPLARRAGLPLERVLQIVSGGPAGMPMVRDRIPKILGTDPEVGFTINATAKDADVFRRVLMAYGLDAPMAERFLQLTKAAIDDGQGEQDPAAMVSRAYRGGGDA